LTCDLRAVPKDSWARRRTLSAVVIAVFPVTTKLTTIRRNVLLRDEYGECIVCVWGNHTSMMNECVVGRAVTFHRVNIQEFEGSTQLGMPKDSSMTLGNTPRTLEILEWLNDTGNDCKSVSAALALTEPAVTGIHGIVARVATETITMKDGTVSKLTCVTITSGPPQQDVSVNFWNAPQTSVAAWTDKQHHSVNLTMVRCNVQTTGNRYESISGLSKITLRCNAELESWWFTPRQAAE
jgi:hypothetical protein